MTQVWPTTGQILGLGLSCWMRWTPIDSQLLWRKLLAATRRHVGWAYYECCHIEGTEPRDGERENAYIHTHQGKEAGSVLA